ncbi:phosphoglycolate phosphatase [Salinarimonas soli]|uniref:Phosphoglycolate phosphatase n=1 Tax=Salinarimonas soli TaxID=1638099 RepID=A0A5B2VH12_9HYPH|nr:phosphoglycolate phosphatase [Salinarimonas soli]KAA2237467.1 phosphoglycolate phosphatase [Salinarimonas soli]
MDRPQRFDAVLLDLDGTLIDSARDLMEALNRLLAEQGLRAVDLDETRAMIGDGARVLVERALARTGGAPDDAARLMPRFLAIYEADASRHTRPYPGVVETLERLKAAGLRLAVVTNKPEAATRAILEALALDRFMDAVVGGDTLAQRKPDPAPLREALRRLGIEAGRAAMVGDNHHDVEAGHAAGLPVVAVSYGYAHGAPGEFGAERLIDRFPDLPDALNSF